MEAEKQRDQEEKKAGQEEAVRENGAFFVMN